jgi:hypothetical protein
MPARLRGRSGGELGADLLADPADRRAAHGGPGSECLGQARLDIEGAEPADEPSDDQGFQGVGPGDVGAQQRRREPLVGPAQLRALQGHRAAGRLDGHRLMAVAIRRMTHVLAIKCSELLAVGDERRR